MSDLEKVLSDIAISICGQQRVRAQTAQTFSIDAQEITLAYVVEGTLNLTDPDAAMCALTAGGALLLSGGGHHRAQVGAGSRVLITRVRLTGTAVHLGGVLPCIAWLCDFDQREPAAAALVGHFVEDGERRSPARLGDAAIGRMLATAFLQSAIRAWVTGCAPADWPARTADPYLERVIEAIQADPGRRWTVEALAALGAMSRSLFSQRFRAVLGQSPAGYVSDVRMRSARDRLSHGEAVSTVARELGYVSDEGFSRAFRRHHGATPSAWRAAHALAPGR